MLPKIGAMYRTKWGNIKLYCNTSLVDYTLAGTLNQHEVCQLVGMDNGVDSEGMHEGVRWIELLSSNCLGWTALPEKAFKDDFAYWFEELTEENCDK